jgi:hypothetical protein
MLNGVKTGHSTFHDTCELTQKMKLKTVSMDLVRATAGPEAIVDPILPSAIF